jgi:hypothetical protein
MPLMGSRGGGSVRGFGRFGASRPDSPTNASATDVGTSRPFNNGAASVSFTPGGNNGAPITSFTVTSSPGGFTASGAASPIVVTGLQSSVQYTYTVTATNAVGTSSASSPSTGVTATTVPQAPTIGTATAGNALATVTYTANATGGKAVSAYTATSSPGSLTGTGTSPITVSGLTNTTAYTFTVTATNANGTSLASAASNSVTPVAPEFVAINPNGGTTEVYGWSTSGFGTKVAAATSPAITNVTKGIRWNELGDTIATGSGSATVANRISVYPWNSGFGTKYAAPAAIPPAGATTIKFTRANDAIVMGGGTFGNLQIHAWPWSTGSGFGTKYASPSVEPIGSVRGVDFSFQDTTLAVAHQEADVALVSITMYAWSTSGFGTRYANPPTPFFGTAFDIEMSPSGNHVAVGTYDRTPYFVVYPWGPGFGTRYANPATIPTNRVEGVAWSPSGDTVVAGGSGGATLLAYPFNNGFGTKYANAPSQPTFANSGDVRFTRLGNAIVHTDSQAPRIHAWPWNAGFGAKYANPSPGVSGEVYAMDTV